MRRIAFLLVALALAACSGGGSSDGATVDMLEGQRFEPETLTVETGTTVTFVNDSAEAHTVTAVDGVPVYFSSGGFESEDEARDNLADALIGQEDTYEVTFDEPGTYEYVCIPHEDQGMTGTIEVEG
ncbi:MAG TPA: plastocyanin/azurin family copper-binding protein [Actinomycetota bacterium]|nr:plastocyanin/azurin family copper-binding protein [Actinomycetota bacterium]